MTTVSLLKASTLALLWTKAYAAIAENGLWTGNDYYDNAIMIGVQNGVPYSNDPMTQHRLTAPLTVDGDVRDNYASKANVQRVMSLFSQADWDRGFPLADPIYTYTDFLRAVAKFPAFCNETN